MDKKPICTTPEQKARYAAKARERRAADPEKYQQHNTPEQKVRYAAAARARRATNPEKYRQRDQARYGEQRREQHRNSRAGRSDVQRSRNQYAYAIRTDAVKECSRQWRVSHPERTRAHHTVANAIKKGILIRPSRCSQCNCACKPDAAHHDYSKPLDVLWLCRRCHMRMDKAVA